MPTEKPILTCAADEKRTQRITDFRFENRIETKSEAIRKLVEKGLDTLRHLLGRFPTLFEHEGALNLLYTLDLEGPSLGQLRLLPSLDASIKQDGLFPDPDVDVEILQVLVEGKGAPHLCHNGGIVQLLT